ncbi:hypothetical protein L873DRAFT_1885017 [Choiromyces venosus 120613-1]|uniref:Uncharacterized protein n=1 Tax=Choiromyces venosus 120613-1 TaxID=1336337 RepID=A0A3N4IVS7_9PEZI|nr:hypothetical protein L873DRAFT_1885017 [Choiromyces venosus 120613-1]
MAPSSWNCFSNGDIKLSSAQKRKSKMTSSVDPTRAITEEEPSEPDLSNPTRNRWERPLDTIRAFEDAIYKEHRQNYYDYHARSNTNTPRNPHYDVYPGPSSTPRSGMDSYGEQAAGYGRMNARSPVYNGRMSPRHHGHNQNYGYPQSPAGPARSGYDRRQNSDSYGYGHRPNNSEGGGHPAHYNAPSPEGYKPPSNSSGPGSDISHGSAGGHSAQPRPTDTYGFAGGPGTGQPELFETSPQLYEPLSPGENWNAPKPNAPTTPPAETDQKTLPSVPGAAQQPESNAAAEKRKSWFKRKMSKG